MSLTLQIIQKNSEHWYKKYKKQQKINNELVDENQELQEQNRNLQVMLQTEREVRCNADYLKRVCELEEQIEKMKADVRAEMHYSSWNNAHAYYVLNKIYNKWVKEEACENT